MSMTDVTRGFLTESVHTMNKMGLDPYANYKEILSEDALFNHYSQSLAEGLEGEVKSSFLNMANHMRGSLVSESTAYGFSPIAPLTMPIFRRMWPQLVAREALTVLPMDKPEIAKSFMRIVATVGGNEVEMPNNRVSVSTGQPFGELGLNVDIEPINIVIAGANAIHRFDLLEHMSNKAGQPGKFNPTNAHITSADFAIVGVTRSDDKEIDIHVEPEDSGAFSFAVDCDGYEDIVSGNINYTTGVFSVSSTRAGKGVHVKSIRIVGSMTQAEEMYANKVHLKSTYVKFRAEDIEIQTDWTIQEEQDYKAYFDIDIQTQLVDHMGKIIAMDIDRRILNKLIRETELFNPTSCGNGTSDTDRFTFDRRPMKNFAWGPKEWNDQIVVKLNDLSAKIYVDTNMTQPNVLIANPLDMTLFKNTANYKFDGDIKGGEYGETPVAGTLNDTWKALSTPLMPQGKILVLIKPSDEANAVFVYAPYKPLVVSPWPLGRIPSMSFISRFATRFIRREGVGILRVIGDHGFYGVRPQQVDEQP